MSLEQVMAAIGSHMKTEFDIFSAQYQHHGLRGGSREEVVKDFLSKYLPANVEIASGEIIDAIGVHSAESDIIILDRVRAPLTFGNGKRLVPVEGVYSVLEVKSRLDSHELANCLDKCSRLKNMQKGAYYPQIGAVIGVHYAYGKQLDHFPTLFSIFAYHGVDPGTLIGAVEKFCADRPAEETLDSIICLDGWLICWWDPEADSYDLIASPRSRLAIIEAGANTLLLFYLMYYKWLSQAVCRPIRMSDYTDKSHHIGKRVYPLQGQCNG